jgi:hypothetical protein
MYVQDEAAPYLDATKLLYKDLLAVGKDASGNISVQSHVYAIKALQVNTGTRSETIPVFPVDNPHNVFWLIVHPAARSVTAFYHAWVPFW